MEGVVGGKFKDFEWNRFKHAANINKHGIDFQDAKNLFATDNYIRV
jgi:uncharacterized DUF497 family protein